MLRLKLKLIYFLISITLVVCVADFKTYDNVNIKRSAVCLIQRIAQQNHIVANFKNMGLEQRNATTHVQCKLELGTEQYTSNSTSFTKAKEKVSRQAYALTKYHKPELNNRTCAVSEPGKKSEISLLEEYAHVINKTLLYNEEHGNSNGTFQFTATLNGKSASGIGYKKKIAKQMAAAELLNMIGRTNVIDALVAKYNRTIYHNMEPTLRLRKIARVTDPTADGIYSQTVVSERQGAKQVERFTVNVSANDYEAGGSGSTLEEARKKAAANLLRTMNFVVTYPDV